MQSSVISRDLLFSFLTSSSKPFLSHKKPHTSNQQKAAQSTAAGTYLPWAWGRICTYSYRCRRPSCWNQRREGSGCSVCPLSPCDPLNTTCSQREREISCSAEQRNLDGNLLAVYSLLPPFFELSPSNKSLSEPKVKRQKKARERELERERGGWEGLRL